MKDIRISVDGADLVYDIARNIAKIMAGRDNDEAMLVAWFDKVKNTHSPSCVKCEIDDKPGWEVYGKNHGGRFKISFNEGEYIFIYS